MSVWGQRQWLDVDDWGERVNYRQVWAATTRDEEPAAFKA